MGRQIENCICNNSFIMISFDIDTLNYCILSHAWNVSLFFFFFFLWPNFNTNAPLAHEKCVASLNPFIGIFLSLFFRVYFWGATTIVVMHSYKCNMRWLKSRNIDDDFCNIYTHCQHTLLTTINTFFLVSGRLHSILCTKSDCTFRW